jgi:hypothetical protein
MNLADALPNAGAGPMVDGIEELEELNTNAPAKFGRTAGR